MSDIPLYDVECVLLATLVVAGGLALAIRSLNANRPNLGIGYAIGVGFALRLLASAGVGVTGLASTLRGYDEDRFVQGAREVARYGFDSGIWLPSSTHRLHEIVFALQIKLADFPNGALRVTQIGISLLGVVLVVAAIHDLAGPRAAFIAAWVFALEPAEIFFNSILHREPLLVLASGLVAFGGTKVWTRRDLGGIPLMGLGCAIAVMTRPYAGWFLITGALLLIAHAAVCRLGSPIRSLPLVYAVAIVVAVATPAVLKLTSQRSLEQNLQSSQDANASPTAERSGTNSNNLALERVDFSTRGDLLRNLPGRVRDVVLRPYPWQIQNTSQRLGAIGSMVVLLALYLLLRYIRSNRGRILSLTAPILYPAGFLLMGYALSVGNAGTGFRYRTHLVLLGAAVLIVLREHSLRDQARAVEDYSLAARGRLASDAERRTPGGPSAGRSGGGHPRPSTSV